MRISTIKVPIDRKYDKWKIRSKEHVKQFLNECLYNGEYYYIHGNNRYYIRKENGSISISIRDKNSNDVFDPLLEIANTKNDSYRETVFDVIWRTRKSINEKWFS